MTPIVFELDGEEIGGVLNDTATSTSLLAQLPLSLTFRDYGGQEKIAELPEYLSLEGASEGSAAAPMTIGYYAPQQSLVLYYDHVGYFAGIVPIGTYERTGAIESQAGNFTVTLRAA
ncbi:cyclophilin-like fold protein [Cryobacterium sp. AP23]